MFSIHNTAIFTHIKWSWGLIFFCIGGLTFGLYGSEEAEDRAKQAKYQEVLNSFRNWFTKSLEDRAKSENRPTLLKDLLDYKKGHAEVIRYCFRYKHITEMSARLIFALALEKEFDTEALKQLKGKKGFLYDVLSSNLRFFAIVLQESNEKDKEELKLFIEKLNLDEDDITQLLSSIVQEIGTENPGAKNAELLHFLISNFSDTINFDKIPEMESINVKSDIKKIRNWIDYVLVLCNINHQSESIRNAKNDLFYILKNNLLEKEDEYESKKEEIRQKLKTLVSQMINSMDDSFIEVYLQRFPSNTDHCLNTFRQKNSRYNTFYNSVAQAIAKDEVDFQRVTLPDDIKAKMKEIKENKDFLQKIPDQSIENLNERSNQFAIRQLCLTCLAKEDTNIEKIFYVSWYFSAKLYKATSETHISNIAEKYIRDATEEDKTEMVLMLYEIKDWEALVSARIANYIDMQKLEENEILTPQQIAEIDVYTASYEWRRSTFVSSLKSHIENNDNKKELYLATFVALQKKKNEEEQNSAPNELLYRFKPKKILDSLKAEGIYTGLSVDQAFQEAGVQQHTPIPIEPYVNQDHLRENFADDNQVALTNEHNTFIQRFKVVNNLIYLSVLLGVITAGLSFLVYYFVQKNRKQPSYQQPIDKDYYLS